MCQFLRRDATRVPIRSRYEVWFSVLVYSKREFPLLSRRICVKFSSQEFLAPYVSIFKFGLSAYCATHMRRILWGARNPRFPLAYARGANLSIHIIFIEIGNRPVVTLFSWFRKKASRRLSVFTVICDAFATLAMTGTRGIRAGAVDGIVTIHFKTSLKILFVFSIE